MPSITHLCLSKFLSIVDIVNSITATLSKIGEVRRRRHTKMLFLMLIGPEAQLCEGEQDDGDLLMDGHEYAGNGRDEARDLVEDVETAFV